MPNRFTSSITIPSGVSGDLAAELHELLNITNASADVPSIPFDLGASVISVEDIIHLLIKVL